MQVQPIPNGFYVIDQSDRGLSVKLLDGAQVFLGRQVVVQLAAVALTSVANDNSSFNLSLQKQSPFPAEPSSLVLCVDGSCVRFPSSGSDWNITFSMGSRIEGEHVAAAFGRYFGVAPRFRRHPGHLLSARFVPRKPAVRAGQPLVVTLYAQNVGSQPFTFMVGGANRGARDNQFGFTASNGREAVPDTGNPVHFGGLAFAQTLQPGETFARDVDLTSWFRFAASGTYLLTGTYRLAFPEFPRSDFFVVWEDFATAEFTVQIQD